jgi:hypothetical protein
MALDREKLLARHKRYNSSDKGLARWRRYDYNRLMQRRRRYGAWSNSLSGFRLFTRVTGFDVRGLYDLN